MADPTGPGRGELPAPASRRRFLQRALALLLSAPPLAAFISACGGDGMGEGMGTGMMGETTPGWMMSRGMDARIGRDMPVIHDLLAGHERIERRVEDIPGGIRAVTRSDDPELAERIRTHVWQMRERIEEDDPIRQMDPLFREIFEHHEAIEMAIDEVPSGVRVTETSEDPQVALLIRQHARHAVSEFVADGMERAMRPTPLPPGYRDEEAQVAAASCRCDLASPGSELPEPRVGEPVVDDASRAASPHEPGGAEMAEPVRDGVLARFGG